MRGRTGFDGSVTTEEVQRVATYRTGPEGKTTSAITNVLAKVKTFVQGLVPSRGFTPSFA